jgi:hypothetical protein
MLQASSFKCFTLVSGLLSAALWSPVISLSVLFLWLGIVNIKDDAQCERPLGVWALVGGVLFATAVAIWLCGLAISAGSGFMSENTNARPLGQPGLLARLFPGKSIFEVLSALRSTPELCGTLQRAFNAILIFALAAWLALGAAWVWPLHDTPHHCSHSLVSVSFYAVFSLTVALLVVSAVACMAAMCLAVCGMSIRNAIDGVVEMLHGVLALSEGDKHSDRGETANLNGGVSSSQQSFHIAEKDHESINVAHTTADVDVGFQNFDKTGGVASCKENSEDEFGESESETLVKRNSRRRIP